MEPVVTKEKTEYEEPTLTIIPLNKEEVLAGSCHVGIGICEDRHQLVSCT